MQLMQAPLAPAEPGVQFAVAGLEVTSLRMLYESPTYKTPVGLMANALGPMNRTLLPVPSTKPAVVPPAKVVTTANTTKYNAVVQIMKSE